MTTRALVAAIAVACLPAFRMSSSEAAPTTAARSITFFVASDTHFGVTGIEEPIAVSSRSSTACPASSTRR